MKKTFSIWLSVQALLVLIWYFGGNHIDVSKEPDFVRKMGNVYSINDLTYRHNDLLVTTYGKVVIYGPDQDDFLFSLKDIKTGKEISCEISEAALNEMGDRLTLIEASFKNGEGIYVQGVYQTGLTNRKIDVRKVFIP